MKNPLLICYQKIPDTFKYTHFLHKHIVLSTPAWNVAFLQLYNLLFINRDISQRNLDNYNFNARDNTKKKDAWYYSKQLLEFTQVAD